MTVCFVLKGAENLTARGHKTEKNITLDLLSSWESFTSLYWGVTIAGEGLQIYNYA
jgi:hypothetical protein